jgi:hypothetical protein
VWGPSTRRGALTWSILAAVALLLLARLGDRTLWGDEAESALLARNVVKYGLPYSNDGRNLITLYGPRVDGNADGIWTWSPWLDEYLIAASFAVFGATAWSARLPCALVGLLCVALVGHWLWRRHRDAQIAWAGMLALGSMEAFLLHARQARYYSLVALAQVLLLHGLQDMTERRSRGKWVVAAALLVQFHCNYIAVACNVPALVAIAWWWRARIAPREVGTALAAAAVGALPWLVYAEPWSSQWSGLASEPVWSKLVAYLRECHFHLLPLWLLAWPVLGWWEARRGARAPVRDPLFAALPLFFASFLLVLPAVPSSGLRYLLPLAPVAAVWLAECVFSLRWRPRARWLLLGALVSSNAAAWLAAYPVRAGHQLRPALVDLVGELAHDYADSTEGLVAYLRAEARPDDTVLVPDPAFPLIFHTDLRIVDARFAKWRLTELPDWIVAGAVGEPDEAAPGAPGAALAAHYERIAVEVHDSSPYGSSPEPDLHEYRTARARSYFIVYRRLAREG